MEKTRAFRTIYTVLLSIIGVIIIITAIGTIIGFARKSDKPLVTLGKTPESKPVETSVNTGDIRIFSGIGRLRIPLVNSSVLVLSIAFPYQASDIAFTEELAGKINEFKTIAYDYFSGLPENEIIQINEDKAKAEILNRFNSALRLGQIPVLYFNDMLLMGVN